MVGKPKKNILIVTGLSGAGKHQVLYQLEDLGYFCMDNLPAPLLTKSVKLLCKQNGSALRLAVGVDVRSRVFEQDLRLALEWLKSKSPPARIIFLEASENELVRRFAETRRAHPLSGRKTLSERIRAERMQMAWLREQADLVLDTTRLTPVELRRQLHAWLDQAGRKPHLIISSFGYKYGLPADADLVFDMRFLPNPFYVSPLRKLNGNHRRVRNFVLQQPAAQDALERMAQMIKQQQPEFIRAGKAFLHVALGCTGGQHRSVVMANELQKALPGAIVRHRELQT